MDSVARPLGTSWGLLPSPLLLRLRRLERPEEARWTQTPRAVKEAGKSWSGVPPKFAGVS